jgi:hypothetical protein
LVIGVRDRVDQLSLGLPGRDAAPGDDVNRMRDYGGGCAYEVMASAGKRACPGGQRCVHSAADFLRRIDAGEVA